MDIVKGLSDSVALIGALIADIEQAVAKGGGVISESVDAVGLVLADEKVRASLSALIKDITS